MHHRQRNGPQKHVNFDLPKSRIHTQCHRLRIRCCALAAICMKKRGPFMTPKLSDIVPPDDFDFEFETRSIGTIRCSSLTIGMLSSLERELKNDRIDSLVFTRKMLREIGRHTEIGEGKGEANSLSLTELNIGSITDEELETFASEFLAHNDWLHTTLEARKHSVSKIRDGEKVIVRQPTQFHSGKIETESNSEYLVRILRRHVDEHTLSIRRIVKPFFGSPFTNTFSNTTKSLLKNHISLSDQLRRTLRSFEPDLTLLNPSGSLEAELTDVRVPDIIESPVAETNRRLGDVLDYARELRPIILQSAELFRNMSDTALQMHADFNQSARRSLFVSCFVACIATISLVVTAVYSWSSYRQSSIQEAQYQRIFSEQQSQIHTLIEQRDNAYRQLFGNQDEQGGTLIGEQGDPVEQVVE